MCPRVTFLASSKSSKILSHNSFANPAAAIPSNPSVPLTHFLPPTSFPSASTLTFIGTKSPSNEIDTSLFYIRVSSLSLRILTLAMAAVYLDPQQDWGDKITGAALRDVFEREGYRDKVLWVPGQWWDGKDAVVVKPHVSEGGRGLVEIEKALETAEEGFRVRGKETYPNKEEVGMFWKLVAEARLVLDAAKEREHEDGGEGFVQEVMELRHVVELRTWDIRALMSAIDTVKEKLGVGDIVGFESVVG